MGRHGRPERPRPSGPFDVFSRAVPVPRHAGARHRPLGQPHAGGAARGHASASTSCGAASTASARRCCPRRCTRWSATAWCTARPSRPTRRAWTTELTPLGHEVAERLLALIELVEGRMAEVLAARERYDADAGGAAGAGSAGRSSWSGSSRGGGASACRSGGRARPRGRRRRASGRSSRTRRSR